MNVETAGNLAPLQEYQPEWASLCAHRPNVLIEGPTADTHSVLRSLQPHIGTPILRKRPHAPLELPDSEIGGLILENVSTLSHEDRLRT